MPKRLTGTLFGIGLFLVIAAGMRAWWFKLSTERIEPVQAPSVYSGDLLPGQSRTTSSTVMGHLEGEFSLLMLRSNDGTLNVLALPISPQGNPSLPAEDGITAAQLCDTFEIYKDNERVVCKIEDTNTRQTYHHVWTWAGRAISVFTPDLTPVPGREEGDRFVVAEGPMRPSVPPRQAQ